MSALLKATHVLVVVYFWKQMLEWIALRLIKKEQVIFIKVLSKYQPNC